MLIAQITDLHIGFDRDNPHELNIRRLNLVIDQINAMTPRPDLLIVSGDLVENGDDQRAYRHMESLVKRWQGPLLWAVGNHDSRTGLREVLPEVPTDDNGFIQYEAEHGGLRFVVIDTLDVGRHGGMVCEARAAWLKARLRDLGMDTLFCRLAGRHRGAAAGPLVVSVLRASANPECASLCRSAQGVCARRRR